MKKQFIRSRLDVFSSQACLSVVSPVAATEQDHLVPSFAVKTDSVQHVYAARDAAEQSQIYINN